MLATYISYHLKAKKMASSSGGTRLHVARNSCSRPICRSTVQKKRSSVGSSFSCFIRLLSCLVSASLASHQNPAWQIYTWASASRSRFFSQLPLSLTRRSLPLPLNLHADRGGDGAGGHGGCGRPPPPPPLPLLLFPWPRAVPAMPAPPAHGARRYQGAGLRCPSPATAWRKRPSRWPQAWLPLSDASSLCSVCARVLQETLAVRAGGRERPAPTPPLAVVPCFRVETLANDSSGGCVDDEVSSQLSSLLPSLSLS